ncbi:MAG: ribosome recycling factor, partial [Elusimicrobiaceae bacterium]|nr:ribosome recycling factor [Elusimicrobiaceae bacterium]
DLKRYEAEVQKATDAHIAKIDQVIKAKEEEIMKI